MRIGGFQKLTLLDYPGQVACIVFTCGCNFRCPYCHNSGMVVPNGAAEEISAQMVLSYVEKRRGLLDGVVVTGGEPLLWPDLPEFLRALRRTGCKIKLDTNGSFPDRLRAVLRDSLIDYAAMDVKHVPERYGSAAGTQNPHISERIAESLQVMRGEAVPFELRTTVVRGIHTAQDIAALAQWLGGEENWYLQSYVASQQVLAPDGLSAFTQEKLEEMRALALQYRPNVFVR